MPGDHHCAVSALTHVGLVRSSNEDMCAVPGWTSGSDRERWSGALFADGGWALVADGMGGHAAGEVASALIVEALAPLMSGLEDRRDVTAALDEANARLYAATAADPVLAGMGTTIAGLVLRGEEALAYNIGDSRIYRWTPAGLAQISIDHALGGGVLTQCLGGTARPMPLDPFVGRCRWEPQGRFLLCSDGLTNMVPDTAIARLLASRSEGGADALVEAALDAGGVDNVTVVVIDPPH